MHIKIDKEIKLDNPERCDGCDYLDAWVSSYGRNCVCGINYCPVIDGESLYENIIRDPKCIEENGK